MRSLRWSAFISWLVVASLATIGFAAFSPRPAPTPPPTTQALDPGVGNDAGAVMAMAFISASRAFAPPSSVTTVGPPVASREIETPPTPATAWLPPDPSRDFVNSPTERPTSTTVVVVTSHHGPPVSWPSGSQCLASWYGPGFDGRTAASGEIFDSDAMTGATHDVAFGTMVKVTRVETGASVVVRINDRGPFEWRGAWYRHPTRCIDLSEAAMRVLGGIGVGVMPVTITY